MKEFGGEKDLIEMIGRSNNTNPPQSSDFPWVLILFLMIPLTFFNVTWFLMKKGAHRQVLEKLFDCLNLCVAAWDYSQHLITAEIKHCSFYQLYTGTRIKSIYMDQVLTK